MAPRGEGTIIFTGATASLRGSAGFVNLASPKWALRAVAQSMARELGPRGIHVAHVILDGVVNVPGIVDRYYKGIVPPAGTMIEPSDVAEAYWNLHLQPPSGRTFELELRPALEKW